MRKKLKLLILTTPLVIAPIVLNPIVLKQNTNQKNHDQHLINQVNQVEKNDLKTQSNKNDQSFNQTFITDVKKENNNSSDKKLETKHWVLIGLLITVIIILVITLIMLTIKKIDQVKNQPLKNDDDEK